MDDAVNIPEDENGTILRRMLQDGDDLSKPRIIDFCHTFPQRRQAIAFAELLDDRHLEVCISYNEGREMWDATVKRYMLPTYQDISAFELSLASKAESLGGEADGWGCFIQEEREH
jgi:hypothetical protein